MPKSRWPPQIINHRNDNNFIEVELSFGVVAAKSDPQCSEYYILCKIFAFVGTSTAVGIDLVC